MENFVVSARKYRPTTFDSVVGQSHITTTLKNAIKNNHLAQAFLFCGPRGVGKTTNARILAKTINCENITPEIEACDTCESCKSFNNSASFNVHELDAASNNSVDDIRNLVDQVRYPPQYGKYKIYIIDEVHMLSNAAFNAFLKTLEEPPKYAIFILATTEKHKIIPTILSRCQIFDFNRIQVRDIAEHLARIAEKEGVDADPQALHLIAQKADGALRDALSIFDLIVTFSSGNKVDYKTTIENLHILDYDYYFKMVDMLYKQDLPNVLLTFDEILRNGFDGHNFIVGLSEHFRNLMVCKDQATVKLLEVSDDVRKKYADQAATVSLGFLLSALNIANSCDLNYKSSKNARLHVELALMKIAHINSALNLAKELTSGNLEVKKKTDSVATSTEPAATTTSSKVDKVDLKPTIKLPSIKDLKTTVVTNVTTTTKTVEEVKPNKASAFTLEDLKKHWNSYAEKLKQEGLKNEYFILANRELHLQENFIIKFKIDNLVQQDQLNAIKPDFLEHLRKNLDNNLINLEVEIAKDEEIKKIYTAQEKLLYLSQKYPTVEELRRRLGLETDY
ncbi:MAG TPA: DNA polymerase III subunit gamma/tau [Cytophagaceae bacterium]